MNFLGKLFVSTISVFVSGYLFSGSGVVIDSFLVAAIVAIVLGVLNTLVKPILVLLTLPITFITLGLFLFVINVALVLLAAYIVPGFSIDSVLTAVLFSIVLSVISSFLNSLLK